MIFKTVLTTLGCLVFLHLIGCFNLKPSSIQRTEANFTHYQENTVTMNVTIHVDAMYRLGIVYLRSDDNLSTINKFNETLGFKLVSNENRKYINDKGVPAQYYIRITSSSGKVIYENYISYPHTSAIASGRYAVLKDLELSKGSYKIDVFLDKLYDTNLGDINSNIFFDQTYLTK